MKLDQSATLIDYDSSEDFEYGPSGPPYSPADCPLTSGRKAFILDRDGWLVVGYGHHLLSGGNHVGAAGQIHVDENSVVQEINLNFSGHYRPPLTAEYARYTFRSLNRHPLLTIAKGCQITARKFFGMNTPLENIVFRASELLSDSWELEALLDWDGRDDLTEEQDFDNHH